MAHSRDYLPNNKLNRDMRRRALLIGCVFIIPQGLALCAFALSGFPHMLAIVVGVFGFLYLLMGFGGLYYSWYLHRHMLRPTSTNHKRKNKKHSLPKEHYFGED